MLASTMLSWGMLDRNSASKKSATLLTWKFWKTFRQQEDFFNRSFFKANQISLHDGILSSDLSFSNTFVYQGRLTNVITIQPFKIGRATSLPLNTDVSRLAGQMSYSAICHRLLIRDRKGVGMR